MELPIMKELPNSASGGPPNELPPRMYSGADRPMSINPRDLPVISVTPQSPGGEEEWNILEGSISQIQGIQDSIQKMRDIQAIASSMDHGMKGSRFCSSCPSLNSARRFVPSEMVLRENEPAGDSVLSSMYMASMPENVPSPVDPVDPEQRLSWSDNDPAKAKGMQRSVSLSSAESDNEDAFSKSGGAVMDRQDENAEAQDYMLQYGDVADGFFRLRNTDDGTKAAASPPHKSHRSVNLQKSVSTPSILGNVDDGDAAISGSRQRLSQHFSGSDSEEEGILGAAVGAGYAGYGRGMAQVYPTKEPPPHVQYRDMLRDASSQEEDATANGKRRKRSSIFFKKKKDKDRSRRGPAVSGPSPVLIGPSASFSLSSTSSSASLFIGGAKSLTLPSSNSNPGNKSAGLPHYHQSTSRLAPAGSSSILNRKPNGSSPTGTATKDFGRMLHEDRDDFIGDDHSPGFGDYIGDCFALDPREGSHVEGEIERDFPELRLLEEEPEAWSKCVDKKISKSMTEVEVKRQEHIYEFMITEKHHCVTLQLMKKLFAGGMARSLNYGPEIIRQIFPCLDDLIAWHSNFLRRLRERQDSSAVVPTISDILVDQFSGECGAQLEKAYGIYCSQHKDAVSLYKDQLQRDRRFQELVRLWSEHPLCKKKGIPECILFVTQRITKYPLLIDPLIKTSKTDPVEKEILSQAMDLVKGILVNVNSQVAEKERDARLLEVYNRIDAKSSTMYLNKKFKKADLLLGKRKLKFEGIASMVLMPRGKSVELTVIVFSDIVLFLQESNQKYVFFTNDGKVCVLPISKLLVREKAGTDHNGFYLISSNPSDPEMYELICHTPKDRKVWIQSIREAIENCPTGEEEDIDEGTRMRDARMARIKQITVALQEYDQQLAKLCEDKIGLQFELLEVCGHEDVPSPPSLSQRYTTDLDMVALRDRLRQTVQEASRIASSLCANGATNLSRSASSVGEHQSNAYVSPSLPRRAETFGGFDNSPKDPVGVNRKRASPVPPELIEDRPRRTTLPAALPTEPGVGLLGAQSATWTGSCNSGFQAPPSLTLPITPIAPGSKEQQMAVAKLSGYLSAIWCLVEHQCTNLESMKAELATAYDKLTRLTGEDPRGTASSSGGKGNKALLSHNQRLEELRNLQDKFTREKEAWEKDRKYKEEELQGREKELKELQDRLRVQTNDVVNQREQLYTKVQTLKNQGIILDANFHIVSTNAVMSDENSPRPNCSVIEINKNSGSSSGVASPQPHSPPLSASASAADFRKKLAESQRSKSVSSVGSGKSAQGATVVQQLPQHLISATNQQKVTQKAQNVQIKQQLPLKLAKLAEKSSGGSDKSSPGSSPSNSLQSPLNMSQEYDKVQQILPMKLSEDRGSKSGFGYQKFGTGGGATPNIPQRVGAPQTFHSRSGSSPADIPPEQMQLSAAGKPSIDQPTAGSGLYKSNSSGSRYGARPYSAVMGLRQQQQQLQQQQPQQQSRPVSLTVTRSEPQTDSTANPRRSVDPDTNEEIIYF